MHARINAGVTQFSLLARLLLFENPCSPESLLLAKRCMQLFFEPLTQAMAFFFLCFFNYTIY
jgi:hypothetical protein